MNILKKIINFPKINKLKPFHKKLNKKGMTLLEIMIVLAILGTLITILATQVTSRLAKARVQEAKIQISEMSKALDMFYTDCGFYPNELSALITAPTECPNWGPDPYLKKINKDPWNNSFLYELDGGSYTIISLGADRREGGTGADKDISNKDE